MTPWAIYDTANRLVFLTLASGEDDVWRWHLGWPDAEEIAAAKKRGLRASRVDVLDAEAASRIEELEAALTEQLAPDDVHTDMPGGVLIRQRFSAKKWRLVRRELPANGVEYTLERREQPVQ